MSTQTEAVTATESAASASTSLGPDGNVVGAIANVLPPLSGILVYLLEDQNQFARFHAAQSIIFGVVSIAIYITLTVLTMMMGVILPDILSILVTIFSFLASIGIWFALFLVWVYLLVMAFKGNRTKLPVLGSIAESYLL
ncbi:DUF4870 domain-containing protein [Natrinema gelatinilyticum]|uniref:DUF4870 domain-containing protein n=1 Tax=Natrinema gelatinilyticum TaxID=2961571 RepID=UPI0020C39545|nr:hypothetical protein [Natrinema gelatinilyticum]